MAPARSPGPATAGRPLGALLLASLLILSVAVFAGTRILREEADIVNSVVVTPQLDPGAGGATIRFELTRADSRADVLVIDENGAQVRALALGASLEPGLQSYRWDGRADDGEPVPPGSYGIRVLLGEQDRDIEPPGTIEVGA